MKLLERSRPTRTPDLSILDRDVPSDLLEFTRAMQEYKHRSARMFPTWSEVLEVLYSLGYRKVAAPTEIYQQASAVKG